MECPGQHGASSTITLGQLPGGNGAVGNYGQTITLGSNANPFAGTVTGQALTVSGIQSSTASNGYSLGLAQVNANVAATTITNNLLMPSSVIIGTGSGTAIGSTLTASGTSNLTLGGNATSYTIVNGDIMDGNAGVAKTQLFAAGTGIIYLTGQTSNTNYSGGASLTNAGNTLRIDNQYALGTGLVAIGTASTLDIRSDSPLTFSNYMALQAGTSYINVDQKIGGTGMGQTITFTGGGSMTATKGPLFTSGNGYSLNLAGAWSSPAGTQPIVNNSFSGTLYFGNATNGGTLSSSSGAAIYQFNGTGGTTKLWDVIDGSGTVALVANNAGTILDLTKVNTDGIAVGNAYSGGLTVTAGTVRVASPNNFGKVGTVGMGGGTLSIVSDTAANVSTNQNSAAVTLNLTASSGINVDQAVNGSGYGQTHTVGAITVPTTGLTLTVTGGDGYGLTTGAVTTAAAVVATTITNNAPGVLTIATLAAGNNAAAGTVTFNGSGYTQVGSITQTGGQVLGLVSNGSGVLDLTNNLAGTFAGSVTSGGSGSILINNPVDLSSTAGVILSGGALLLRNNTTGTTMIPGSKGLYVTANSTVDLDATAAGIVTAPVTLSVQTLSINGSTLSVSGSAVAGYPYTLSVTGTTTQSATAAAFNTTTGNLILMGQFSSGTAFTTAKNGAGTLTLNGASTDATGAWTINAGVVNANAATSFATGAATITVNAATLNTGNSVANVLTGANALTINTGGLVNLGGSNSYTGVTTVAAGGSLYLNANGAITGSSITVTGGTLTENSGLTNAITGVNGGSLSVTNANAVVNLNSSNTFGGSITLTAGALNLNTGSAVTGGTVTVSGGALNDNSINGLNGAAALSVNYSGNTVTLGYANNFSNGVTLTAGTLRLQDLGAIGTSAMSLAANTTLQLRNNSTGAFTGGLVTVGGNATIDVDALNAGTSGQTLSIPSLTIGGAFTLNVLNGGGNATSPYTLNVSGTTTESGNVVFNPTTANLSLNAISNTTNTTTKTAAAR